MPLTIHMSAATRAKHSGVQTRPILAVPEALYYCLLLSLPFEEALRLGGVSISKCIGLLFLMASCAQPKKFYGRCPGVLLALLGFFCIGLIGDLVTAAKLDLRSINELGRPILVWILVLVTYNLCLNGAMSRVLAVLATSSLGFALCICLNLDLGGSQQSDEEIKGEFGVRSSALNLDVNFSAVFVAVGGLYCLDRMLDTAKVRPIYRLLYLLGVGLGFAAMLKTGSRGGLLAFGCGLVSLSLSAPSLSKAVKVVFALAVVGGIMVAATLSNPYLVARFTSSFETQDTSGRMEVWEEAVRLAAKSPWYGFGYRTYMTPLGAELGRSAYGTHNTFLAIPLMSGFFGSVLFLYFYAASGRAAFLCRTLRHGRIVLVWFVLAAIAAMSLNMDAMKWFWIVLALPGAVDKVCRNPGAGLPSGIGGAQPQSSQRVVARSRRGSRALQAIPRSLAVAKANSSGDRQRHPTL